VTGTESPVEGGRANVAGNERKTAVDEVRRWARRSCCGGLLPDGNAKQTLLASAACRRRPDGAKIVPADAGIVECERPVRRALRPEFQQSPTAPAF
jgi:hypothetical protein